MKPVILLTHVTKSERTEIAELCIPKMKELLPGIPIHLYSININEEDRLSKKVEDLLDYVCYMPNEEHYTGEIKSWDLAFHELEKKGFDVILKSCSDCLWNNDIPKLFLEPVLNNEFDLVVSNTWLYFCGGPHCASTQIFGGTLESLKATLPSKDRNIPWYTNGMEINFRIGIQELGKAYKVKNYMDATPSYFHGHTKKEFGIE